MKKERILYGGLAALDKTLREDEWSNARYVILVDENTFSLCMPTVISQVIALQEAEYLEVPVGEECKSVEIAAQLWQTLVEGGHDRQSVLVSVGGGAVSDLGGFVSSTFMRGIRHIVVPTTLLAMADAAIGGKTAVDFAGIKNVIGTFYFPSITCIDRVFLSTLEQEHIIAGLMEMVKTAAVTSPELYYSILSSKDSAPARYVNEVARMKWRVVKADPKDYSIRNILNFGHTFGHAIEVQFHLAHGIAVGIGMLAAMYLSVRKLQFPVAVFENYYGWIKEYLSLPVFSLKEVEQMLALMHHDKKCVDGYINCVLLRELGVPVIDVAVSDNEVRDTLLRLGSDNFVL